MNSVPWIVSFKHCKGEWNVHVNDIQNKERDRRTHWIPNCSVLYPRMESSEYASSYNESVLFKLFILLALHLA